MSSLLNLNKTQFGDYSIHKKELSSSLARSRHTHPPSKPSRCQNFEEITLSVFVIHLSRITSSLSHIIRLYLPLVYWSFWMSYSTPTFPLSWNFLKHWFLVSLSQGILPSFLESTQISSVHPWLSLFLNLPHSSV